MTLPERFWVKVNKTDTCWLWTGATNSRGYGAFGVDRVAKSTHRLAYEHLVGPIADGLTIDHLCMVKTCCNPQHLEPVTRRENTRRYSESVARKRRMRTSA